MITILKILSWYSQLSIMIIFSIPACTPAVENDAIEMNTTLSENINWGSEIVKLW